MQFLSCRWLNKERIFLFLPGDLALMDMVYNLVLRDSHLHILSFSWRRGDEEGVLCPVKVLQWYQHVTPSPSWPRNLFLSIKDQLDTMANTAVRLFRPPWSFLWGPMQTTPGLCLRQQRQSSVAPPREEGSSASLFWLPTGRLSQVAVHLWGTPRDSKGTSCSGSFLRRPRFYPCIWVHYQSRQSRSFFVSSLLHNSSSHYKYIRNLFICFLVADKFPLPPTSSLAQESSLLLLHSSLQLPSVTSQTLYLKEEKVSSTIIH